MLDTVCSSCHNLNRVQTKNLNQDDWMVIVERMKGKGVEISDDDTMTLIDYLVKNYGPKVAQEPTWFVSDPLPVASLRGCPPS
jgi:hypothetical protein